MKIALSLSFSIILLGTSIGQAQRGAPFRIEEATIAQIHAAMTSGRLTCAALVDQYLQRIESSDKKGPAINAITVINPNARAEAAALDAKMKTAGLSGPLHCVPMIVKDNFETAGLQTAAGSLALKDFDPGRDAFQVRKIKEAGAIVLAKSNMAEWAFSPYETVNSVLPGYTRNPYALDRVTAGSSGGTAAAVAANFGAIGLGSDTGNSIRGPSSHQALVGIRSTMGLTSRGGVVPLSMLADIAGPMARTVEDAVAVFQVIVGEDPADPVTLAKDFEPAGMRPGGRPASLPDYKASLVKTGLKGARIGILRQAYERDTTSPEIVKVFMTAVEDMKKAGAIIIDPATVEGLDQVRRPQGSGTCGGFKYDINRYLASLGDRVPVKNLEAIIRSRRVPSVGRAETHARAGGIRKRSRHARVQSRGGLPGKLPDRGAEDDGSALARRVRLPDVEQSTAADRRPEHTARRQQPGVLTDDRVPVHQCPDGLYGRGYAAGRRDVLRQSVGRGDTDQARLQLRAGHAPSSPAEALKQIIECYSRLKRISNTRPPRRLNSLMLPDASRRKTTVPAELANSSFLVARKRIVSSGRRLMAIPSPSFTIS